MRLKSIDDKLFCFFAPIKIVSLKVKIFQINYRNKKNSFNLQIQFQCKFSSMNLLPFAFHEYASLELFHSSSKFTDQRKKKYIQVIQWLLGLIELIVFYFLVIPRSSKLSNNIFLRVKLKTCINKI